MLKLPIIFMSLPSKYTTTILWLKIVFLLIALLALLASTTSSPSQAIAKKNSS